MWLAIKEGTATPSPVKPMGKATFGLSVELRPPENAESVNLAGLLKQYPQRTEKNVIESDGTVIFTVKTILAGGSKKTAEFAAKHHKPWIHLAQESTADAAGELVQFLDAHRIAALNVARSRASRAPGVYQFAKTVLTLAIER